MVLYAPPSGSPSRRHRFDPAPSEELYIIRSPVWPSGGHQQDKRGRHGFLKFDLKMRRGGRDGKKRVGGINYLTRIQPCQCMWGW